MRLALMIMGLALAAVMGFQSFTLMTHPFASDAISSAAGTGVIAALIVVVGAAFCLQYPIAAVIGFGGAALLAITTGLNSPYSDLSVWGWGLAVLAALAVVAMIRAPKAGGGLTSQSGAVSAPPVANQPEHFSAHGSATTTVPSLETNLLEQ